MKTEKSFKRILVFGFMLTAAFGFGSAHAEEEDIIVLDTVQVVGTAEEQVKQSLGVSIITKEDIEKHPPANDLSEIIRRQPGVNLTGNSASGSRGNNRQIDLRGMGPENTLILIDGRPVSSRNSVRYGWAEERDTRGDSNWVPAEMVERIEVLRGPAAARYGSGAMGGVVNIITKKATDKLTGSLSAYTNIPEDSKEGGNTRFNFSFSGPVISDKLSFRVYGSRSETEADEEVNPRTDAGAIIAGREGVTNEDINTVLSWAINSRQSLEFGGGYSRQSNEYAGDAMNGSISEGSIPESLLGEETNIMRRRNYFVTHTGNWNWGFSRVDLSYEGTHNTRLDEGLAGATEGAINTDADWNLTELENYRAKGEVNIPFAVAGIHQTLTVGAEYLNEKMKDPGAFGRNTTDPSLIEGYDPTDVEMEQYSYAVYVEDNIYAGAGVTLTPGVRFDYHEVFGSNVSPSLNAMWEINENWTVKGGIARAYKAPNLYQTNPNYLLFSNGNGCFKGGGSNDLQCYLQGNEDLDAEISINKEIGLAYDSDIFRASATYFHNDYENKVYAGKDTTATFPWDNTQGFRRVYQWENAGDAVIEGVEGSIFVAIGEHVDFSTNITYMIESEMKRTGQPLSIVPEYTINSFLDWRATDKVSLGTNVTFYGKQVPPTIQTRTEAEDVNTAPLSPYNLVGIYGSYKVIEHVTFRAGVNNLFNKRLYREGNANTAGAATYNEPGRSYYASMTMDF